VEGLDKLCLGEFEIITGCEVYSADGSACDRCDRDTVKVETVDGADKLCLGEIEIIIGCEAYYADGSACN